MNPTPLDAPWRTSKAVLLAQRKLILKKFYYAKNTKFKALRRAVRAIRRCKTGRLAAKLPPKPYDCNNAFCSHCHHSKRQIKARQYAAKFQAFDHDEIHEIVVKLSPVTPDRGYHDDNALRSGLRQMHAAFTKFRRTARRKLPGNDKAGIIKGGVYGIHTLYDEDTQEWDIHLHAIVAGRISSANEAVLRRIWKEISNRNDGEAFYCGPVDLLIRKCGYIIPSVASTFTYKKVRNRRHHHTDASLGRAIHHPAILDAWLDALSPVPGTSAVSTNRTLGTWGVCRGPLLTGIVIK